MTDSKNDFTVSDLPKNRREAVIHLAMYRKSAIFPIAIYQIAFSLPLFFWIIFSRYFLPDFFSDPTGIVYILIRDFPYLFFVFLYAVGLSGAYYSARRLLFGETVVPKHHFFKGIKDSGLEFGLFSLIFMVPLIGIDIVYSLVLSEFLSGSGNAALFVSVAFLSFLGIILLSFILSFVFSYSSLYNSPFFKAIGAGFRYAFLFFPKNLGAFLLSFVSYLFLFPGTGMVSLILNCIGIGLLVFGKGVMQALVLSARASDVFDSEINVNDYPEYYRAGLAPEDLQ